MAIFATVLLAAVGVSLWRTGAFTDRRPDVPSCADLAGAITPPAGGTWTLRRADPPRELSSSTASCLFQFSSADRRFTGEITVEMWGHTDSDALRHAVDSFPCYGEPPPMPSPDGGYLASRQCLEIRGDRARAGMSAATRHRFAHTLAAISGPATARSETAHVARDIAGFTAERALSLVVSA